MLRVANLFHVGVAALAMLTALFIGGCGGGGGGDDSPPPTGNTAAAGITTSNVSTLANDVALAVVMGLTARVGPGLDLVNPSPLVDKQDACQFPGVGTATFNLTRDPGTGNVSAGSGTYTNFDHCTSWVVNGSTSGSSGVTGLMPISTGIQEFLLNFSDLSFSRTSPAQTYHFAGTIDLEYKPSVMGSSGYVMIVNGTVRNASLALVATLQNFQIDSDISAGQESLLITGRMFDAVHGYVDLSTTSRFIFVFPGTTIWNGSFTMTGSPRSATVTYTNGVSSEVVN